ncbi:MAG TPA: hypothetical protein VND80_08260 [Steroidobacteraceae bacterium]|nr:hypothetical protein [Steroidobacteraceae bacterium]
MSVRARHLAARRERLLARSATLRGDLRRDGAVVSRHLQFADRLAALAGSPWKRLLASAVAALLLFRRPRRLLRLLLRLAPLASLLPSLGPPIARWLWNSRASGASAQPEAVNPQP